MRGSQTSELVVRLRDGVTKPAGKVNKSIHSLHKSMRGFSAASSTALMTMRGALYAAPIVAGGIAARRATQQAIGFESAMANVSKVVEFETPQQFEQMRQQVLGLTKTIPMAAQEIAALFEAGGQAGLARSELAGFAEDAAKVSTAFQLTAEQAGEAMARMRVIFGLNRAGVQKLNDTINVLGNNTNAKERDILDVLQRAGAAGKNVGLTAENTAALGAAMLSTGTASEVVSTGLNSLFAKLGAAGSLSDKAQEALRKIGLSSAQIQKDMMIDPNLTIMKVLERINSLPQDKKVNSLVEIFGLEYQDDVARLAAVYPELAKNFAMAGNRYMQFRQAVGNTKGLDNAVDETDNLYRTLKHAGKDKRVNGVLKGLGLDAKNFAKLMEEDAGKAMSLFLDQLRKAKDPAKVLQQLGARQSRDELLKLAKSAEEVRKAYEDAASRLNVSGSMDREFEKRMQTTQAQMQLFANQWERIGINFGDKALPALNKVTKGISELLNGAGLGDGENKAATWFDQLGAAMDGFAHGVGAKDFNTMMRDLGASLAGLNKELSGLDAGDTLGSTFMEWKSYALDLMDTFAEIRSWYEWATGKQQTENAEQKQARLKRQIERDRRASELDREHGAGTRAYARDSFNSFREDELRKVERDVAIQNAQRVRMGADGVRRVPTTVERDLSGRPYTSNRFVRPNAAQTDRFGGPFGGAFQGSSPAPGTLPDSRTPITSVPVRVDNSETAQLRAVLSEVLVQMQTISSTLVAPSVDAGSIRAARVEAELLLRTLNQIGAARSNATAPLQPGGQFQREKNGLYANSF
jgi:TP901 family phage tail tape measure protein